MSFSIRKWAAFIGVTFGLNLAQAAVWNDVNTWDDNWEHKFSSWVEAEFNEDIFVKGKYKNISTDCADAVYFGRLIFAYENKLPYVVADSTGGQNMITNRMSRWDSAAEFDRVREMMKFIEWSVSTKTFARDSYPVKINRQFVRAGAIWVRPSRETNLWNGIVATLTGKSAISDPGHAETIKRISDSGAVMLIGSTTPSTVRTLTLTSSFLIMPESKDTGIRNWLRPEWYGKPRGGLPGYSEEQFTMGKTAQNYNNNGENWQPPENSNGPRSFHGWRQEVQTRLAQRDESRQEVIERHASDLCSLVRSRAEIVQDVAAFKAKRRGGCLSESEYDAYSTPTRDKRIKASLKDLTDITKKFGEFNLASRLKNPEIVVALNKCESFEIAPGRKMTLLDYMKNVANNQFSSDPNDSIEARWGLATGASSCPKY